MQKYKVLFVCLGNICRSPIAEGIMRYLVSKEGLEDQFYIDSAGTSSYHIGELPDPRSIEVARDNGIQLVHKARQFKYQDFEEFDLIIAMDLANKRNILALDRKNKFGEKVKLCSEFDKGGLFPSDVPDPYYGGDNGFQEVFDQLSVCTKKLLDVHHPNKR